MFHGFWLFPLLTFVSADSLPTIDCSEDHCWSEWSPCTVTCIDKDSNSTFAKKWRIWKCTNCSNSPKEKSEFANCDHKVPFCLWHEEHINAVSNRTVTRLIALGVAALLLAIPTLAICCRYTPGHPLLCCRKKNPNERSQSSEFY